MRIRVQGKKGDKVVLQYRALGGANRGALQRDTYILKGGQEEVWQPRFTYHGFVEVEITGFPGEASKENFTVCLVHSDVGMKNSFISSNTTVNDMAGMYRLSQRDNLTSIPTDCNQRDERMGWGGDAVATSESSLLTFHEMPLFFEKWFRDMDDDFHSSGASRAVVPAFYPFGGGATWGSIRTIIPWETYLFTGDSFPLTYHYDGIVQFANFITKKGLLPNGLGAWGDWVSPVDKSKELAGHAYSYAVINTTAKIAKLLNKKNDAEKFSSRANQMKEAYNRKYPATGNGNQLYHSLHATI